MKNLVIKLNSTRVLCGIPSNLANNLRTIGNSIIKIARATGGKIPEIIPTMTLGSLQIHASQL